MEEIESGCIPESNFMRQHHYQKSLDGLRLCAAAAAMNEGWRMLVPLIDAVPATVVWQAEYALQIRKMSSNLICPVNGEGGYDSVYDEDVRAYVKKSTKSFKQLSSFWKVVQVEHDKFQGYPNANDGELGNLRSKHMDGSELDATKYSNGDEGLRRDALIYLRASQGRENKQIVDELERTAAIEKWDPVRSDYVHKRIKAFCNFTGRPMPKTRRNRSSKGSD